MRNFLLTLLLVTPFFSGCTTLGSAAIGPDLSQFDQHFGSRPNIPPAADIFELTPPQKQQFLDYFNRPDLKDTASYMRVYDYLAEGEFDFKYKNRTQSAAETLGSEAGNCMSLAVLTAALAKLADVRIGYQLVDSTPVFDRQGNLVTRGEHIRTKIYARREAETIFSLLPAGIVVDYFTADQHFDTRDVEDDEFLAMYYNNRAAEFLTQKDYRKAYWYSRAALELTPRYGNHINTMAIILRNTGDMDAAEALYQFGLKYSKRKLVLLKNYRVLLKQQSRQAEVADVSRRIDNIYDSSPYNWLDLADESYADGNYVEASRYYAKAVELAPYLELGYLGLARTWFMRGELDKAEKMLVQAATHSRDESRSALYDGKLMALAKLRTERG